jgi:hypothetical protein
VKVGQQSADNAKLVAGIDEEIGAASASRHPAATGGRHRFQRTRGGRADGNHAPPVGSCPIDRGAGLFPDLVRLLLHRVILDAVHSHRLERAVADVQRDLRDLDAARHQRRQQRGREMQPCCRRRHRPALARVHRLIPIAIRVPVVTLDVRRQRHVANRVDRIGHRRAILGPQPNQPASEVVAFQHLAVKRTNPFEHDLRPGLQFLPRVHQRLPGV